MKRAIICVDDESIVLHGLRSQLESYFGKEYLIELASSGEEALEIIEELMEDSIHIPVLVTDQIMPEMKGTELLHEIVRILPKTFNILLTGQAGVEDVGEAVNKGNLYRYISKPWDSTDLQLTISEALKGYEKDLQIAIKNDQLKEYNDQLKKFVPFEFLNALGRELITEVSLGDNVQQEVTVLFLDIRGYTTLAEKMTPQENFQFVNAFHGRMGPIIKEHNGFVNQYLGDAIMAIFPDEPEDCLSAAIALKDTLRVYNQRRVVKGRIPIRMGIGMHTGALIMGIIGDEQRFDAATISDTVNTASRVESLSKYYKANILLSEISIDQINKGSTEVSSFNTRFLGKVRLKGKEEPVGIYECFDGDSPEDKAKKLECQTLFKEAMNFYLSKQFEAAKEAFGKVLTINENDLTAKLFIEKSNQLLKEGVPENWSGVEYMTFK